MRNNRLISVDKGRLRDHHLRCCKRSREVIEMRFRTVVLALVAALAAGVAQAQQKWDMPTPYIDAEFHTQNIRQFAEEVKKATGGQLDIVVHSGQSLIKHPDILRAVSTGQVNIAEFIFGQFANEDPVFAADNLPFVATGYDN